MMQLDISCVNRWIVGDKQIQYPSTVGISCPECSMRGAFTTKRRSYDDYRDTLSCSANCPACDTQVHFWITNAIGDSGQNSKESSTLYMMPGSPISLDLSDLPDNVPPDVVQYCASTIDVYATGNLTATNVLAKSAIEAIFEEHLPLGNSKTTLAKLVADSIESIDMDKPLKELANSLKPDGNLYNLLSSSQYTSKDSADALLTLLDRLINYLYVLPNDFKALEKEFAELNRVTNLSRKGLSGDTNQQDAA